MLRRIILFVILVTITTLQARAAVFLVTSNADSGPGTFREALTLAAANGSAEKDFITFLLPDVTELGRTIILRSQLPDVSSNLVIDGSTQPGIAFGVSTAKVHLLFNMADSQKLSGLRAIEQRDIEIYGLYIKADRIPTDPTVSMFYYWRGIELKNDINVQIGAAGKGNVCFGFSDAITVNFPENVPRYFDNLTIKGSFFAIDADGRTLSANPVQYTGIYHVTENLVIGGSEAEGNVFAKGLMIYQQNNGNYTEPEAHYISAEARMLIRNNKIGVDYAAENAIPDSYGFALLSSTPGGKNTANIEDNVIASDTRDAIHINNSGRKVTILRNYIGTDKLRQKTFFLAGNGVFIYGATEVAIGSNNPADANYITNTNPVWVWPYSNTTVNKNSFYCVKNVVPMRFESNGTFPYPVVEMQSITSTGIAGTATPNSNIELFYSDNCNTCAPQTYFGSATANSAGDWIYNGAINGSVIASATLGLNTSNFTTTTISTTNLKVINACNDKGSIVGAVASNAQNLKWIDEQGNTAGTAADLTDVKPGKYKLIADNGSCSAVTDYIEIKQSIVMDATAITTISPSCNPNGQIMGIKVISNENTAPVLSWTDGSGKEWGTGKDLTNVPAGSYTLTATSPDNNCVKTYGPVILTNPIAPVINQTNFTSNPTLCNQSVGSITGVTVTGGAAPLTYSWKNTQGFEVGTNPDLINQPTGFYTLYVTDASQCAAVAGTAIEIVESNGVSIDYRTQGGRSSTCNESNGSITGLKAPGATTFVWTVTGNATVVGRQLDLTGVPANFYTLTISNATCSRAYDFEVPGFPPTVFTGITYTKTKTCDAFATGTITLNTDNANKEPLQYQWFDEQGNPVGYTKEVLFLKAGKYSLKLTNKNYCIVDYPEVFTIEAYPEFKVNNFGSVTNTQCGVGTGGVSATVITGGTGNYVYQWFNADTNAPITGKTQASVDGLLPGHYKLQITDGGCNLAEPLYNITDKPATPPLPSADNIRVYNPGSATIKVNNPFATAIYRLYETATSIRPIKDTIGGVFNINVTESRSYYISLTYGYCESGRTEVKVFLSALTGDIANTFTPNGDGINDYWAIKGLDTYPDATVSVYNRYGSAVYQSVGYAKPFDGTFQGKALPAGVYFYIINLKRGDALSGHLTIIR